MFLVKFSEYFSNHVGHNPILRNNNALSIAGLSYLLAESAVSPTAETGEGTSASQEDSGINVSTKSTHSLTAR